MKRYEKNDEISYSLGMSLTIEALKHRPGSMIEVILSDKANKNSQFSYLLSLCEKNHVPYRYDERDIERLSVKENCYCIGVFRKFYSDLETDTHILLYGFNDFGELGTVLRSSVCFDFHDIVLISSDIDRFDPRCIRASMGSIFHCNIIHFPDLEDYIKKYPAQRIYPFTSNGSRELSSVHFEGPYSLLISQGYDSLDDLFKDGIILDHRDLQEISLSIRSSIILEKAYDEKRVR